MNTRRYQFRLSGLRENKGWIKVTTLQCSLNALVKTAECATRLMFTGEGSGRGPRPRWLNAALDFTLKEEKLGSTTLEIEAPQLGETAYTQFAQQNFWREQLTWQDTAVDLAALSVQEALEATSSGDYFDRAVLSAILKFRQPTGNADISYHLIPQESDYGEFTLNASVCNRIEERLKSLPPPRAFIISGWLEEIKHDSSRFFLDLSDGRKMFGRLQSDQLDVEALRPLWGKRATVQGMIHFKANGQPRLIEAHRLRPYQDRDALFEELPPTEMPRSRGLTPKQEKQARSFNVLSLCGTWPGNEPVEELLAQLD